MFKISTNCFKKSTSVTIHLEGTSTIIDLENIENEEDDNFEGAAIKLKSDRNFNY